MAAGAPAFSTERRKPVNQIPTTLIQVDATATYVSLSSTPVLSTTAPVNLFTRTLHLPLGYTAHKADSHQCFAWCALSALFGAQGILQCFDRGDTREKYGIDGNACTDCLVSCCCTCCGLVQQDREVKEREEKGRLGAASAGYQKIGGMAYPPGGPGGPVV